MLSESLGALSLAIWLYLVLARGSFWRIRVSGALPLESGVEAPAVAVIVPARNEADVVKETARTYNQSDIYALGLMLKRMSQIT